MHGRGGVCPPGSSLVHLNESRALHPSCSHAVGHWDATGGCWAALGALGLLGAARGGPSLQGPGLGARGPAHAPCTDRPHGRCPRRVQVEFYVNENTFKERLKLFFIKNQRSSECSPPARRWGREAIAICWQPAPSGPGAEPGCGAQPGAAATPCPVPSWSWGPP